MTHKNEERIFIQRIADYSKTDDSFLLSCELLGVKNVSF